MVRASIVIPLYNKERWILRALDSIARQTFSDFEVLIVDDGSADRGAQIVAQYGDARFRLIIQQNAGPGAARNRGIAEAKGQFLAFLDADDEWLPTYLEESLRLLDSFGSDVASVTSGYFEFPAGISREPMWRNRGISEGQFRLNSEIPPLTAVYALAYMSPWSTVARSQIVRKWGGFYSQGRCLFAEDSYLWLKVLLNETVAFQTTPLVLHHVNASELGVGRRGVRPVEPFLQDPSEIESICPARLRPLLSNILAIRAFKSACMLGYWGRWREANSIRKRFSVPGDWALPYFTMGMICSTPVGASLGQLSRALKGITLRA